MTDSKKRRKIFSISREFDDVLKIYEELPNASRFICEAIREKHNRVPENSITEEKLMELIEQVYKKKQDSINGVGDTSPSPIKQLTQKTEPVFMDAKMDNAFSSSFDKPEIHYDRNIEIHGLEMKNPNEHQSESGLRINSAPIPPGATAYKDSEMSESEKKEELYQRYLKEERERELQRYKEMQYQMEQKASSEPVRPSVSQIEREELLRLEEEREKQRIEAQNKFQSW